MTQDHTGKPTRLNRFSNGKGRPNVFGWIVLGIAALLLLIIVAGIAGGGSASPEAATPTPSDSYSATVPNLVGKDGAAARDALQAAGLLYAFDAGEDTVIVASNWNVTEQSPGAGEHAPVGSTVTLTVVKPVATTSPSDSVTSADSTKSGLTSGFAMSACDAEGDAEFPYGFKGHWIIDGKATMLGDTWVLVAGGEVTNAFNADRDVTVTCVVTGSNNDPQVTRFSVE